jgi:uncharacterized protein related to proFAR isomerase
MTDLCRVEEVLDQVEARGVAAGAHPRQISEVLEVITRHMMLAGHTEECEDCQRLSELAIHTFASLSRRGGS